MEIKVKVIPNASKNEIREESGIYKIHLKAKPLKGEANRELIEFLAKHFNVKKSQVEILSGMTSRAKAVKIN